MIATKNAEYKPNPEFAHQSPPLNIFRRTYHAMRSPAPRGAPVFLFRTLLSAPIFFDLSSLFLQLLDLSRLKKIRHDYAEGNDHHKAVQDYNAYVTQKKLITTTRRTERCYQLLAFPLRNLSQEKILIVGPRNIQELYIAWLHGFSWQNIQGIDLYSTNPKIQVMNMENMTFPNEQFDAVAMTSTISYAEDTRTVVSGVARILKTGGRFCFSSTYFPEASTWKEDKVSGAEMAEILRTEGFEILFHSGHDKINAEGYPQTNHWFMAQKIDQKKTRKDPFYL